MDRNDIPFDGATITPFKHLVMCVSGPVVPGPRLEDRNMKQECVGDSLFLLSKLGWGMILCRRPRTRIRPAEPGACAGSDEDGPQANIWGPRHGESLPLLTGPGQDCRDFHEPCVASRPAHPGIILAPIIGRKLATQVRTGMAATIAPCRGAQPSQTPPKARRLGMFARGTERPASQELSIVASHHTLLDEGGCLLHWGLSYLEAKSKKPGAYRVEAFYPLDLL